MSLPVHPVHPVSTEPAGASSPDKLLVCADNLEFMRTLSDGSCNLVYADPPFFTGQARSSRDGRGFDDRWEGGLDGYLDFLRPRLGEIHRLLARSGSFYLHLDWRTVHYAKVALDRIFGADNLLNEIIWSYRTGGVSARWFGRKHDTLLYYAKQRGEHVFNVKRDGAFRTDGLNHDENGRPYKSTKRGRLYFHADGPALTDVWDIPFLSTVSLERTGYPSQKPEALLARIIEASSNPGDLVADFFCGSGTTLAVAKRLGRRWIGCDNTPESVATSALRLGVTQVQEITNAVSRD